MSKHTTIEEVVDEILQSILATPKRQRRLLSKTFWDKFGFKVRSQERVGEVRQVLDQRSLMIHLEDAAFGDEDREKWIVLTYIQIPIPPDAWFATLENRLFESEREVEYYFIAPLLERLGYVEDDIAIGYPVQMHEGVSRVTKEADFVLFNGTERSKEAALLIIEAKKKAKIASKPQTEDAVGQARSYAMWLTTPYYLVTNGDEVRVYSSWGAVAPDVILMNFQRSEMRQNWNAFFKTLNKATVVERKKELSEMLAPNVRDSGG
jgi:hypothetical protein